MESVDNQISYLKDIFEGVHTYLMQVLYPKLNMKLKEEGQIEKVLSMLTL